MHNVKVEFHTEQNEEKKERFKILLNSIMTKYGDFLDVKTMSKATGINPCTLYENIKAGKIRNTRSSGDRGKIIISAYDAVKFIEQNATGGR